MIETNTPASRIAILYSHAQRSYFPTEQQYMSEAEVLPRAQQISGHLNRMGHTVELFPGNLDMWDKLKKFKPELVLNLVDSVYGREDLCPTIPATLEILQVPYTGTGLVGLAINSNKYLTKNLLEQYGITTPKYQLIKSLSDQIDLGLDYPLIAKLNEVHGSVEIDDSAICVDEKSLKKRIAFLMKAYNQPVLLEEFVVGREVTVVVVQGKNMKVYAAEKIFPDSDSDYKIISFDDPTMQFAKYDLPDRIKAMIKRTFSVLKMDDYAKFDMRVDESGRHYIIDCNSNTALGSKEMFCPIGGILDLYGVSFDELLHRLIHNATKRRLPLVH